MPKRIQRKRTKGWKMPPNTVSVCRPGRWGNPFKVGPDGDAAEVVRRFKAEMPEFTRWAAVAELRGQNLACWCRLDQPCHADVLLELANCDIVSMNAEER
jgi:hypothetical protein